MVDSNKESVPHFEIYVSFDTFEEELTDETVKKIDCLYKEEYLGVKLNNYLDSHNPYIANNDRVTFSVKAAEAQLKQSAEAEKKTNAPIPPPPPLQNAIRIGGRKNKHSTVKRRHKNKRKKNAYTRRKP
jgi:hypothetical protein